MAIIFMFLWTNSALSTSWDDVAYQKKYDELEGESLYQQLSQDKQYKYILESLAQNQSQIDQEIFCYYKLLSSWKAKNTGVVSQLLELESPTSERISYLKFLIFSEQENTSRAIIEFKKTSQNYYTSDAFNYFIKVNFLSLSEQILTQLTQNANFELFEILQSLNEIKQKYPSQYKRFMQILQTNQKKEELKDQLLVEFSPQVGKQFTLQALRNLCLTNSSYCINTTEYMRQNKYFVQSLFWSHFVQSKNDLLKYKMNYYVDKKKYSLLTTYNDDVLKSPLAQDNRYQYFMAYSWFKSKDCQKSLDWIRIYEEKSLKNEKTEKIKSHCVDSVTK